MPERGFAQPKLPLDIYLWKPLSKFKLLLSNKSRLSTIDARITNSWSSPVDL